MYNDIRILKKAGYEVTERSPWHFQVEQGDSICNIWPSKKKYMVEFGGGASYYDDVVEAVASIVGAPGGRETRAQRMERLRKHWNDLYPVPQHPNDDDVWRTYLDIVVEEIHRKVDAMDF